MNLYAQKQEAKLLSLREQAPMPEAKARMLNPLQLAHVGDTVWELLIRSRLIYRGLNLRHMHQGAVDGVNAAAQAASLRRIEDVLTEQEAAIVLRGRNAHAKHPTPKNQDPADYQAATALEALIGYLYLTGQDERLLTLFQKTREEGTNEHARS